MTKKEEAEIYECEELGKFYEIMRRLKIRSIVT